ncbi:MAG: hypothetical protein PF961_24145 [Planctomycetota bacterium]|jgi:hypothetical protein|nr:hypothetical protein [Planctomycetota bacterium]
MASVSTRGTTRGFIDPAIKRGALPPASFGVAERKENGDKIYLRLPPGVALDSAVIEVAGHRFLFSFAADSPFKPGKHNLVLRGITFRHFASRTKDWGREDTIALGARHQQLLIEDCAFNWNNATGLRLQDEHITVRNSEASYNGHGGFGGEFGIAVLENNVTNYNQWRGAWGGMYGWNWGGVKFGGAHGGNQTIRGHESIGNLTHGFWYDIHPHHIDLDGLVLLENKQTGLDLELAQGPFTVTRMLAAGNHGGQFTMSIVGEFSISDSILYGGPGTYRKLKDKQVPSPVVNMQWYLRNDEHAKYRPIVPTRFEIRDSVVVATSETSGLFLEHNGYKREHANYGKIDQAYQGNNNLFFAMQGAAQFTYVQANWQPKTVDLAGWQAWTREQGVHVTDPGFTDGLGYDFTLSADSPLADRAAALPAQRIDPAKIAEARRFAAWAERGLVLNGEDMNDRLTEDGITTVE